MKNLFFRSVSFDSLAPARLAPAGPTFGCSTSRLPRRSVVVNFSLFLLLPAFAMASPRVYEIWEPQPAPNNGSNWESTKADERRKSYDKDWEQWSYPIGNGYVGASIFGRTDSERIQITDKTLHNKGIYGGGGLTNFAEVYLDF